MSKAYQSKRDRWQRMLEALPASLREPIFQRNIETVAALSPQAQTRLEEANHAGPKRLSPALDQLHFKLNALIAGLIR